MREALSIHLDEVERGRRVADALRAQWRMFERVTVRRRPDGDGFEATIYLNPTLVRGAAEQRSFRPSAATAARHEAHRLEAIAACVDRVNDEGAAMDLIRGFIVVG